jgi:hypothetical protein
VIVSKESTASVTARDFASRRIAMSFLGLLATVGLPGTVNRDLLLQQSAAASIIGRTRDCHRVSADKRICERYGIGRSLSQNSLLFGLE